MIFILTNFMLIFIYFKEYECEIHCYSSQENTKILTSMLTILNKYKQNIKLSAEENIEISKVKTCVTETSCYTSQRYYVGEKSKAYDDQVVYGCKHDYLYGIAKDENWQIYDCDQHYCNYKDRKDMFGIKCVCDKYTCENEIIVCGVGSTCWTDGTFSGCKKIDYIPKYDQERLCRNYKCNTAFDIKKRIRCYKSRTFLDADDVVLNEYVTCEECVILIIPTEFGLYYSQNCKSNTLQYDNVHTVSCKYMFCNDLNFLKDITSIAKYKKCFSNNVVLDCDPVQSCYLTFNEGNTRSFCDFGYQVKKYNKANTIKCDENYCNVEPNLNKKQLNKIEQCIKCFMCSSKDDKERHTIVNCTKDNIGCYIHYRTKPNGYTYTTGCLNTANRYFVDTSPKMFESNSRTCVFDKCNTIENIHKLSPKHNVICNNCSKYRNGYCIAQGIIFCYETFRCATKFYGDKFINFSCGPCANRENEICCEGDHCNRKHIILEIGQKKENEKKYIKCYSCKTDDCIRYPVHYCESLSCYISYDFQKKSFELGCNDICVSGYIKNTYYHCCHNNTCNENVDELRNITGIKLNEPKIKNKMFTCITCDYKMIKNQLFCLSKYEIECSKYEVYCMNRKILRNDGQYNLYPFGCQQKCNRNRTVKCCKKKNCNDIKNNIIYDKKDDYYDEDLLEAQVTINPPSSKSIKRILVILVYILMCSSVIIVLAFIIYNIKKLFGKKTNTNSKHSPTMDSEKYIYNTKGRTPSQF